MEKAAIFTDFPRYTLQNIKRTEEELNTKWVPYVLDFARSAWEYICQIQKILKKFRKMEPRIFKMEPMREFVQVLKKLRYELYLATDETYRNRAICCYNIMEYFRNNRQNWTELFNFAAIQENISACLDRKSFFFCFYEQEELQKVITRFNKYIVFTYF